MSLLAFVTICTTITRYINDEAISILLKTAGSSNAVLIDVVLGPTSALGSVQHVLRIAERHDLVGSLDTHYAGVVGGEFPPVISCSIAVNDRSDSCRFCIRSRDQCSMGRHV